MYLFIFFMYFISVVDLVIREFFYVIGVYECDFNIFVKFKWKGIGYY